MARHDDKLVAEHTCGKPERPRTFSLDTGVNMGGSPRYLLGDDLLLKLRDKNGWTLGYSLEWRRKGDEEPPYAVAFQNEVTYEGYLASARENYRRSTAPQRIIDG